MKFPEIFGSDLFGNSELDKLNFIDEILKSNNYNRTKDFEAFIVKLADRNRISIQELTANNMLSAIEKSKKRDFDKVLFAIGIKDVGEVGAKNLANHFKNLDNLINASYEELISIRDVGNSVAGNILDFFSKKSNIKIIERLKVAGLKFQIEEKELVSNKLDGLTFVVSGTFSVERNELKKMIEDNGGKNISALSKSTSYLIVGENMGPSKKEKAEKDNIKMISEEEFFKMLL